MTQHTTRAIGALLACALPAPAQVDATAPGAYRAEVRLDLSPRMLDWEGTRKHMMMYMPSTAALSATRPAIVTREPEYRTRPRYATIQLGAMSFAIAVDEPDGELPRIWLDLDGDGDLSDDNDGSWPVADEGESGSVNCRGTWVFTTRWAGPDVSGDYGLNFYYAPTRDSISYYRAAARVGRIDLGGKSYEIKLIENDNDARFDKMFEPNAEFFDQLPTRPVWLMLDGSRFDIRGTFPFDGMNLEARVSDDGARLAIAPTYRVVAIPQPKERPKLIEAGSMAPDFRARIWRDGGEHEFALSDFRGQKVVVLDMWATWCGPCRRGLPHLSKIAEAVRGQDVAVIAINVFDEQAANDAFRAENETKYAFTWARDPAGKESDASFAKRDYRVSGIPATFVIDKDGKIAAVISGYDPESKALENALRDLGVVLE